MNFFLLTLYHKMNIINNLISNKINYISQSQRTHLTKSVNHSYFLAKSKINGITKTHYSFSDSMHSKIKRKRLKQRDYIPFFQSVVIMNIHKIIKSLMLQSISFFGMYLFKNTPIPLTSQRGSSLAKDPNCKLL